MPGNSIAAARAVGGALRRQQLADRIASGKKRCSRCRQVKSLRDDFGPAGKNARGDGFNCYCRPCMAEYKRERLARQRCVRCRKRWPADQYVSTKGEPTAVCQTCRNVEAEVRKQAAASRPPRVQAPRVMKPRIGRQDLHALPSMVRQSTERPRLRFDPDPIELSCPACTLEWSGAAGRL